MAFALADREREARERGLRNEEMGGPEQAQERLDPAQARAIEAMGNSALKRALQSPDLEQPANAGVRAKVIEVLSARLGPVEVDRLLVEQGRSAGAHPWMRAVELFESHRIPGNLVPFSADEIQVDADSGRFVIGTPAAVQFDAKGRKVEFEEVFQGYLGSNGLERLEGMYLKSDLKREAVVAMYVEGTDLVIETESDLLRVDVESLPETRYMPGEYGTNRDMWRVVLEGLE